MRIDWPTMFAIFLALVLFELVNQTIILPKFPKHKIPSTPKIDGATEEEPKSIDGYLKKYHSDARTIGG